MYHCQHCDHKNAETNRFCEQCGTPKGGIADGATILDTAAQPAKVVPPARTADQWRPIVPPAQTNSTSRKHNRLWWLVPVAIALLLMYLGYSAISSANTVAELRATEAANAQATANSVAATATQEAINGNATATALANQSAAVQATAQAEANVTATAAAQAVATANANAATAAAQAIDAIAAQQQAELALTPQATLDTRPVFAGETPYWNNPRLGQLGSYVAGTAYDLANRYIKDGDQTFVAISPDSFSTISFVKAESTGISTDTLESWTQYFYPADVRSGIEGVQTDEHGDFVTVKAAEKDAAAFAIRQNDFFTVGVSKDNEVLITVENATDPALNGRQGWLPLCFVEGGCKEVVIAAPAQVPANQSQPASQPKPRARKIYIGIHHGYVPGVGTVANGHTRISARMVFPAGYDVYNRTGMALRLVGDPNGDKYSKSAIWDVGPGRHVVQLIQFKAGGYALISETAVIVSDRVTTTVTFTGQ